MAAARSIGLTVPRAIHVRADRVIWRLDWKRVHRKFNFPELALLIDDLHRLVGRDGAFTPWRLIDEGSDAKPFACMIEPPTLDARISAQTATRHLTNATRKLNCVNKYHAVVKAMRLGLVR